MNGMTNTLTVPYESAWTSSLMNEAELLDPSSIGCSERDEERATRWFHRMEELIAAIAESHSR